MNSSLSVLSVIRFPHILDGNTREPALLSDVKDPHLGQDEDREEAQYHSLSGVGRIKDLLKQHRSSLLQQRAKLSHNLLQTQIDRELVIAPQRLARRDAFNNAGKCFKKSIRDLVAGLLLRRRQRRPHVGSLVGSSSGIHFLQDLDDGPGV